MAPENSVSDAAIQLGPPRIAACLVDGHAPRLPAGTSWVALPPEALTSARVAAGRIMLVAVSQRRTTPPGDPTAGAGARSPGSAASPGPRGSAGTPGGSGTSSFGPAPDLLSPDAGGAIPAPQDLWSSCRQQLGVAGGSGAQPVGPGTRLLPARLWPSSRLPRSCCLLSPCLREAAGQPAAGTVVLLYDMPPGVAAPAVAPTAMAAAATNAGVGAAGHAEEVVVLRMCAEALLQPPAGFGDGGGAASGGAVTAAAAAATTAAGTPKAAARGRGPATTPGSKAGGSAASSSANSVSSFSNSGSVGPGPLQVWPLQTLRRAAEARDEGARSMLCAVARRHLAGLLVLRGAPAVLPVLGSSVLCEVAWAGPPATPAAPGQEAGAWAGAGAGGTAVVEVGRSTRVLVLYPGEALPEELTGGAAVERGGEGAGQGGLDAGGAVLRAGANQKAVAAAGRGRGGLGAGGLPAAVAAARAAAAAAVAESAAEAAADAAERALRAGYSSGGVDFSHLGGVGEHLRAMRELVALPLRAPGLFAQYGIRPPRGVLLHGPPGSGKTVLARAAAADAGAVVFVINGPDVVSEYYGESEASLRGIFAAARALSPSVVFIDEVDALAPAREGSGGSDVASRLVTALLTLMDGADEDAAKQQQQQQQDDHGQQGFGQQTQAQTQASVQEQRRKQSSAHRPVVVIAATNRPDALDSALRRPGRLEREIEIGVPTAAARLEILKARLRSVRHSLAEAEVSSLAAAAHGFVSADLAALVDEAAMCALRRIVGGGGGAGAAGGARGVAAAAVEGQGGPAAGQQEQQQQEAVVTLADFRAAETRVRPSALREVAVDIPTVGWGDVGGMEAVKQALKEAVEWPHKAQGALSRLGAQPPRGILLYGPPGCSKTLLARAVACEARLNFLSVKAGELVSKYVGESEKAIAGLFARARAVAPSIIFFDEIDGLVGSRAGEGGRMAGGGGGASDRVLGQLLMEMDGLQDRGGVTVLAATNRPDCVDPALLRPGRFDRLIRVPLPDQRARAEILRVHLRRCPAAPDVDVCALAARSAGYSGADLAAVVREAGLAALEEDLGAEQVAARHFEIALATVVPSVPPSTAMMDLYDRVQRSAVQEHRSSSDDSSSEGSVQEMQQTVDA